MARKACTDDAEDFSDINPYLEPYKSRDDYDVEKSLPWLYGDRFYLHSSQRDFIGHFPREENKDKNTIEKSDPAEIIEIAKRAFGKGELEIAEKLFVKAMRTGMLDNSSKKSPEPYFYLAEILEKKAEDKELKLLKKQRYLLQAAALYNFVRNYLESRDTDVELSKTLLKLVSRKLLDIQDNMVTLCGGNPLQSRFNAECKKNELKNVRNEVKESLESIECQSSSSNQGQLNKFEARQVFKDQTAQVKKLSGTVSERMKQFFASIIDECLALLGTPSYDYEVIVFGSLARNETTPYSDFEWAILTSSEEEDCKVFFRNLTNLVHLQVINLGETILPSMNIDAINGEWFYDDVTPRGVSFDGLLPQACKIPLGNMQDFELIHTPEKMAEFQSKDWYQKNWSLADTLMTFVALRSEKSILVEAYRNEIDKILSDPCDSESCQHDVSSDVWPTRGSCRGLKVLHKDLSLYGDIMTDNNDLDEGKFYDVKKEIYRLPDRVIAALAKCCEVKSAGIFAILDELYEKEVISSEARDNLASASAIAIRLRLSTYLKAGKQGELQSSNSNKAGKKSPVYHMPTDEELFHFFFVAIPLHDELLQFKTSGEIPSSFANCLFFNDSDITMGHIYCRLLKYDKAIECYERAVQENPNNLGVEIRRIRLALLVTHNTQELDNIRENLDDFLGKIVKNFAQLDTNDDKTMLEFTPLMDRADLVQCNQLTEGLLYAHEIYHSRKYLLVAWKILNLDKIRPSSNKSLPKDVNAFTLLITLNLMRSKFFYNLGFPEHEIDELVLTKIALIEREGVSTKSIVLLNSLGELLFDHGKLEKAYRCFRRALSMEHLLYGARPNVKMMTSLHFLGMIGTKLEMHEESKFYFEYLVQKFESFGGIKSKLLIKETYLLLLSQSCTVEESLRYAESGLKVTTGSKSERELVLNCHLYSQLALKLHFQQSPERAREAVLNAQACWKNCTDTHAREWMMCLVQYTLCDIKRSKEEIELMEKELQKFTSKSQVKIKVLYLKALAEICLSQGLATKAKKYYSQAIDIQPENDEIFHDCRMGKLKAVCMEDNLFNEMSVLDEALSSALKLPASDKKSYYLQQIGELCEGISDIVLARQCYDEALSTYKEEANISSKLPFSEIYLEMKLGELTKKMSDTGFSPRIHYDRAAIILRQHVETGLINSRTVSMIQALAKAYRSIDRNEGKRFLLECLKGKKIMNEEGKSQEMVATLLQELSRTYYVSGDMQNSMKYRERQITMELELYSSNPFIKRILNTLMEWALTSFHFLCSKDSVERVSDFLSSSLNDLAFLPDSTATKTIAAKCFTFIAVLFYTSGDFKKAKSLNEKASQLFGEVQKSIDNESDPCHETCDFIKTIFSSEILLPSHRTELYIYLFNISDLYPNSGLFEDEWFMRTYSFVNKNQHSCVWKLISTLVKEQNTSSPPPLVHSHLNALEYSKSKGEFGLAAEIHASLQPQQLLFYKNSPFDGEKKLISEAIEAKNKNQPSKAIRLLDLALELQLPEGQCSRTTKILQLRGECFLSMGHFRSAVIDFTKADALYSTKTMDNRDELCEYSEVLIGLIKSEILCNNVEAGWLVYKKGMKLAIDHKLNQQAAKLFYLNVRCINIFLERGEEKENKLLAHYLYQEVISMCDNLTEEVLKTIFEILFLLDNIFPTLRQESVNEYTLQETDREELMKIADGVSNIDVSADLMSEVSADLMSKAAPEILMNVGVNFSLKARLLIQNGDIDQSIKWIDKSLAAFCLAPLPDFMWFYEEFLPLLQAITVTKPSVPGQSRDPFQQAVDMCTRTLINQNKNSNYVNKFLTTSIIIFRSLGQAQKAMIVAEISLEISDMMWYNSDSDKLNDRCTMLLHLAQIHQQNSSNPAFNQDEEFNLAENYYLCDRGRKEDMVLCKDLSYANFLCKRKRFTEAVAVLEDIRNLDNLLRNKFVYIEYFSCAFYGAGVEKSVKIDGELFTTVEHVLYNLLVQAYVGMGKRKEAVATCETLTDINSPDVHEPVYGKRPSCKPYLVEDCHRELLSLLSEEDRHQFQKCDLPLSSPNVLKLYFVLGEYEMAVKYFPEDAESPEMLEMQISCLRLAGNELIDSNKGDKSISFFQQFLEILQVKEGFLGKPFNNQCESLQTYYFANQYYLFRSLGKTHAERENIDAAIQSYERCMELNEDFTYDQNIVATLSELYQTKALTVQLENEDSSKDYMDLAWELFQKLFQKTVELTTFVELSFASLLRRLGRYQEAVEHFYKIIERADSMSVVTFGNLDKPLVDVYLCREIEALGGRVVIPIKVLAIYELILILMKLNQIRKAEKVAIFLENVVKQYPRVPVNKVISHSMAGYAYTIIGNKEKATEMFVSVLKMNLRHPPVVEALQSFGDLKIKCYHHGRGCPEIVRLKCILRHVDQCGFAPVICGNKGCGMIVNKSEKENHEKNFCKFRIAEDDVRKASQNEMEASKKIQYYGFLSLGLTHYKMENIDAAIQCFERCIELDEDFTCGQGIVATLSKLYQTKALTVDLDNEDSSKVYMDLAWKLFQKLFQKTAKLTMYVELSFALLLKRLDRYEEAVEHFYKVIERADRKSVVTYGNVDKPLVDSYLRREIEALDGSVDVPIKVLAVYELILLLMKLDRVEKAQEFALFLESFVEKYNLEIDVELTAYFMAGYAYKIIGNKEKAAEIFVSVLEKYPGHPPLIKALESLLDGN